MVTVSFSIFLLQAEILNMIHLYSDQTTNLYFKTLAFSQPHDNPKEGKVIGKDLQILSNGMRERERVLVRIIALSCFACFTTFHRLFLEAGSSPVLGSSM